MQMTPLNAADAAVARRLREAALGLAPRIRELAPRMRADRKLDDELVEDMEQAGLFSILVPKRWGGAGLGPLEANAVVEIIGAADCSTAWVASFYMLHNWFLCKFPLETQAALYADTNSVRAPAVFGPPGKAVRVDGGYRVSGRWPYGTGAWHGSHALVPAMVGEAMHWFIMRREEVELIDDWHVAAMNATGSVTIAADEVFVADGWHMDINLLVAPPAPGEFRHEEVAYALPFSALLMTPMSLTLGALDFAVETAREKLSTSRPLGAPRITRPMARVRWAEAYQAARVLRLVRDAASSEAIAEGLAGIPHSLANEARHQLHLVHLVHGAKDALRLLLDGLGSSSYRTGDPLFRAAQDVAVLATHARGPDYDVVMDRHARWMLGLGVEPGDPGTRLA
jgi:alkylation response protein AidB-like acyl-CoA dehydrogenase